MKGSEDGDVGHRGKLIRHAVALRLSESCRNLGVVMGVSTHIQDQGLKPE